MNAKWILITGVMLLVPGAARAEKLSVKVDTANFREGPSTSHPVNYSADRYYPVEVLERKDGWCRTRDFEGDIAWIAERLLSNDKTIVIAVPRANVREKPEMESEIVFRADRSEAARITKRNGSWLQILDSEGRQGWIHQDVVWGMLGKD